MSDSFETAFQTALQSDLLLEESFAYFIDNIKRSDK
jgi:hypothetical protein